LAKWDMESQHLSTQSSDQNPAKNQNGLKLNLLNKKQVLKP